MAQTEKQKKAFMFALIAGIFILSNTALLGIAATWFPELIPTLPGESTNDTQILFTLTVIGLILGILVLLGALLLHFKPEKRRLWGVIIVIFSIPSVITGGGFIIGFILGIIGGIKALSHKTNMQTTQP